MNNNQRMSPRDLNPAILSDPPPSMPQLFQQPIIEKAGPRLNIIPTGNRILFDMGDETSPDQVDGIIMPAGYKKPLSPFKVVTALEVGAECREVKKGDKILIVRAQHDPIGHDGQNYWLTVEGAVVAIVR